MNWLSAYSSLDIRNGLRRFDRARKRNMQSQMGLLLRLLSNRRSVEADLLPQSEIKRILIVRTNSRIGNSVFLLPFIRQIRQTYPDADITLMQKQPWQKQFFAHMGITHFTFSQFCFKTVFRSLKTLARLRRTPYDLCIMPFGSSQDSIICALANARNKVAFNHNNYNPAFTHIFPKQFIHSHAALSCLSLLPQMGHTKLSHVGHQMGFSQQELADGLASRQAIAAQDQYCIAFFRGARGNKNLDEKAWSAIMDNFAQHAPQNVTWVEIMGPEIAQPLNDKNTIYRAKNLRELAGFLKHVDMFISCDTGPLHLADAADAPCVGLYTHTNPDVYGLLGENCVHVDNIHDFDSKAIMEKLLK